MHAMLSVKKKREDICCSILKFELLWQTLEKSNSVILGVTAGDK